MTNTPRTVEVCYNNPDIQWPNSHYVCYGQGTTGWHIRQATITEAPRDEADRQWIRESLETRITPDGHIIHAYKEDQ
ncbi:hypothetical protein [Pseudarthrobacter sp. PS3-L1]|uniref:hypothetical protein n=1 Tax=Pseudarthrobacter sp. PS3-L1 TaxID=3046207 RepID=UPI0024B9C398|nr:hypothetical protein [Pseudarthrobacter sp. PS3-L1]MDJ0321847.1 hypothetical protein [Pseudarthrobacter sp. PS3-L1]